MSLNQSEQFLNIIKNLIDQKVKQLDCTKTCIIDSVNSDGTLNIFLPPDMSTKIPEIANYSNCNFKSFDSALLYCIRGEVSNSFVIAKIQGREDDLKFITDKSLKELLKNINQNPTTIYSGDMPTVNIRQLTPAEVIDAWENS